MSDARAMNPWQVLAEPVRVCLIELLCVSEATSGELAVMVHERFGIGWPAVSRHLATLSASGFVECVRDDPARWYLLAEDWFDLVQRPLADLHTLWMDGAATRELGIAARLEAAPAVEGVPSRRGQRGHSAETTAAWGRGRAEPAPDVDGGLAE